MRVVIREVDKGFKALQEIAKNLKAKDSYVKVGALTKDNDRGEGLNNAQIAAIHEFGSPKRRIPERSFVRATVDENKAEYALILKNLLKRFYSGEISISKLLAILGQKVSSDMQRKISSGEGVKPPLKPSTILARYRRRFPSKRLSFNRGAGKFTSKGRIVAIKARPLLDTGQLVRAITYEVIAQNTPDLLSALREPVREVSFGSV